MKRISITSLLLLCYFIAFSQWTQVNSTNYPFLKTVYFVDSLHGYAAGSGGDFFKTIDGGQNWSMNQIYNLNGVDIFDIYFTNLNIGFAVDANFGYIFKTIDGGNTWTESLAGDYNGNGLRSIDFVSSNYGFAVGDSGKVFSTNDAGANWTMYWPLGFMPYLNSIKFVNANVGFIVGWDGIILKTTDSGNTWTPITLGTNLSIFDIFFTDNNTGFAVGDYGLILKTTDGGTTWSDISFSTSYGGRFRSVFFANSNTGYISDEIFGCVYKTSNAGTTWTYSLNNTSVTLMSIWFTDSINGCVVGDNGRIYRTTTGGFFLNLNQTNNGINDSLTVSSYPVTLDAGNDWTNYLWSNGSNSQTTTVESDGWYSVIVSTNSKLTLTDSIYVLQTTDFGLTNNEKIIKVFPNPSSGHFKIQCNKSIEKIEILNVYGKSVYTERPNNKQGEYSIDISSLPKGVFITKLTINERQDVIKVFVE